MADERDNNICCIDSFNPFQSSGAFRVETIHLFCLATYFYMSNRFLLKRNAGLKWAKLGT